ncbi:hypothetical protein GWK47_011308 [Chionoecetes opilio]|uniref:MADF domain-containing protein n=1 Tax=Chionoecetes opilio TaxID=41210 RepID=A0A8J4XVN5_CHIOP|nr:hypothetical protein GWK47_011308 [Chionoecetes opilio]
MYTKKSGKMARKVSPPTSTPATSMSATSPPAPSTSATSTSATSPPAPSMPGTSNSADQEELVINLAGENGEVVEQVDDEESDDDKDPPPPQSGVEQPQQPQPRKRRRKSTNIILTEETERMLGEWLEFEVPYLYDKGDPRHKQKEHIEHVWAEKAASMEPPITTLDLMTWFTSLRSRFGRLTNLKSGDGAKRLTERENWIMNMFQFLKPHIVRQKKPRTLGMPQHLPQTMWMTPLPAVRRTPPQPSPCLAEGEAEKPPGAATSTASTPHETLEQVLATAEKVRHNLAGVMDVVEDPELQYWRASLDVMAKDCVGLPAGFNTPLKMELMAALHRFRTAHEEGVTKPGPDLMLHAYRNFGFPAPQPQPQAQQHPPATTVMYQGTPATTLPQPMPTQPKPASFVLPPHQWQYCRLLTVWEHQLQPGSPASYYPATPAQSIDPDQTLETPKKPP